MSVFDGIVKTPRAVPDPFLDHTLPPGGALNYAAIASPTALQSTNGVVTSLVHGDHDELFNGNERRTITLDREHTVHGNQTSTVFKDRHDEIQEDYNQHVMGTTQRVHIGATAEHFVGVHTNSHQSDRHVDEPKTVFHVFQEQCEYINKKDSNFWHKVEMVANKADVCFGTALDVAAISIEVKPLSLGGFGYAHEASLFKSEEYASKASIGLLENRVQAVETRAGASNINILAVFVTPFALGIYL